MDENVKEKTENENAGDFCGHFGAEHGESRGLAARLAREGQGRQWGQVGSASFCRCGPRGTRREIGLMADHGMYDIVARVRQACEGQVAR